MIKNNIISQIKQQKGTFLSLDQLREWISPANYRELHNTIAQLQETGLLRPVGSPRNNNGMVPPLRLKYRILHPARDDSDVLEEIKQLSTELNISGYLKRPVLYRKHRDILLPLSRYLKSSKNRPEAPMSKNERAFSIWNREKVLDSAHCQSVLRFNGWENRLNYYPTPEPFFDYLTGYLTGDEIHTLLILENKDTWYTLRRLLLQFPEKHRLFGARLDGVVLGEGRKAARPHALEEYASLLPYQPPQFLYFGDLDYAGIDIFLSVAAENPSLSVSLFLPAYQAMLRRSRKVGYGKSHTDQTKPERLPDFLRLFPPEEADEIKTLLAGGRYLPQEILNRPFLEHYLTNTVDITEDRDV